MTRGGNGAHDDGRLFDQYADSYQQAVNDSIGTSGETVEYFARLKADYVAGFLGRGAPCRALDFGCGTGLSTRALRNALGPQARIIGVDPSAGSVAVARQLAPEGVVHDTLTASSIPLDTDSMDVAVASCVFHHIDRSEHARWLNELVRVVRPGGRVFIFEHNPYNPLTRRAVRLCPFDEGVILLTPGYTRRAMQKAGLVATPAHFYFFLPNALGRLRSVEPFLRRVPLGAQYFVTGTKSGARRVA
jgi:ubiquinone/menaquinone biosynthesis C-methylase UbiE